MPSFRLCETLTLEEGIDCVDVSKGWNGTELLDLWALVNGGLEKMSRYVRMSSKQERCAGHGVYPWWRQGG